MSWFRRTYNTNSFWLTLLTENTLLRNKNCLMQSSMPELRRIFLEYKNPFWSQAFSALEQCSNFLLKDNPENYLRTNTMKNNSITPLSNFEHQTITYISLESMLDPECKLLSLRSVNSKYPSLFRHWLHLGNFKEEVKTYVDRHLKINTNFTPAQTLPTIDYITFFLTRSKKGCKHFYKTLVKSTHYNDNIWSGHKANWDFKLGPINQDDWENAIGNFLVSKYSNKLVDLNLQIVRNNIITNDRLLTMNKTNSNKCNFCDLVDNTLHRIYECIFSRKIWFSLDEILAMVGIFTFTDKKQCLLGDPDMGPNTVKNFLISNTKLFLNNCHSQKNKPTVAPYIWYLAKISHTFNDRNIISNIVDNKVWKKLNIYFNSDPNT